MASIQGWKRVNQ